MPPYTITITDEQKAVLKSLTNPHIAAAEHGAITAIEIHDDHDVVVYHVQPDGTLTYERLVEGFHYGWTRFDSEGYEIDTNNNRVVDGLRDE